MTENILKADARSVCNATIELAKMRRESNVWQSKLMRPKLKVASDIESNADACTRRNILTEIPHLAAATESAAFIEALVY